MRSDLKITQLSRGDGPAVHYYYDIPVEEPGGKRIVYYEFDGDQIPGPGKVMVARADGSDPQEVGRGEESIGHVGAQAHWAGTGRIAYSPRQQSAGNATLVDLESDDRQELPYAIRSYSEAREVGAMIGGGGGHGATKDLSRVQTLRLWDAQSDAIRTRLTAEQAHAIHPQHDRFEPDKTNFQNAKFSPDGSHLFVVFGTEVYRNSAKDPDYPSIKCLLLMRTDGEEVAYLSEFGHHPMWMPDGSAIVAFERDRERETQHLMRYPLDGSAPEMFLENLPGIHATLDRAGRRLVTDVFAHQLAGKARIMLVDVATGERQTLAEGVHEQADHLTGSHPHPQWSRDESRIFFNMADTGVPQLYAVRLPG